MTKRIYALTAAKGRGKTEILDGLVTILREEIRQRRILTERVYKKVYLRETAGERNEFLFHCQHNGKRIGIISVSDSREAVFALNRLANCGCNVIFSACRHRAEGTINLGGISQLTEYRCQVIYPCLVHPFNLSLLRTRNHFMAEMLYALI